MNDGVLQILYMICIILYLCLYVPGTFIQSKYNKLLVILSIIPIIFAFIISIMLHSIFNISMLIIISLCIIFVLREMKSY